MADKWAQYAESTADKWGQFVEQPQAQQLPQSTIPTAYGFTPGHMLSQGIQGVAQLGQGIYSLGKDLVQNPNWAQGPDSTLQKFVLGPAAQMKQKAQTAPTTAESLGYSAAEALPILGPWAAGLGEQAGTGDVGGAVARGGAQIAVPAALQSPIVRGAAKGAIKGGLEGVLQTKIAGGAIRGAIQGVKAARTSRVPIEPSTPASAEVPDVVPKPRAVSKPAPTGAESDIEMEARLGTTTPPEAPPLKGVGDKLGTAAEEARFRESFVQRDTAKKALESGKAATAEKQLVGPDPYASKSAPKMEDVQSTNVNKIGHTGKHLWVEYKTGQVYQYKDVPEEVFKQAKGADSVGSFLSRNIKGYYDTSLKGTARK